MPERVNLKDEQEAPAKAKSKVSMQRGLERQTRLSRCREFGKNAVPSPPNKRQKQNMPGKPSDADSLQSTTANLAINDGNKLKIAEAGGIQAVVAAMKAHRRNVYMQQHACWALRYLVVNDGNQVKIAEAGGIEAVVTAMDHNREVLVEAPACAALWYITAQGSLRQRIKTAGGVQ